MSLSNPVTMLVTYRPKKGKAEELEALVEKHRQVLRKTGLITSEPVKLWKAIDKRGHGDSEPCFVEIFQWCDEEASAIAHETPEVMAIWEPMGPLLEELELARIDPLVPINEAEQRESRGPCR